MSTFKLYFDQLTQEEQKEFAKITQVSVSSIKTNYSRRNALDRHIPRPETIARMILASKVVGKHELSPYDFFGFFYGDVINAHLLNVALEQE